MYLIMKEMENMKSILRKVIGTKAFRIMNSVALGLAMLSINSTCVWVHHQPKVPEKLKKMAKANENNNK
jgi:cyclic lactone autoinducer peptide